MANKKLETRLAPITHAYLQDLVNTGAYGTNVSDVARALIEEGIRRAFADKIISVRQGTKGG